MKRMEKLTKTLNLDLNNIPDSQVTNVKREVGEFIIGEILRSVSEGESPVEGEGAFQLLSEDYAEREKGGDRTPNMELEGDMLDALDFRNTESGVEVGIFGTEQAEKAEYHNQIEEASNQPVRRFIPAPDQVFTGEIVDGINRILNSSRQAPPPPSPFDGINLTTVNEGLTSEILLEDLLGDDLFSGLFNA